MYRSGRVASIVRRNGAVDALSKLRMGCEARAVCDGTDAGRPMPAHISSEHDNF